VNDLTTPRVAAILPGGPRRLMKRLREVMAGMASAEERLHDIVSLCAAELGADVCSCYVLRGDVLELFATVGLRQEAVHLTRLRLDEGIIGDIAANARPLALSDAPSHPSFAYRPETGEDPFTSMAGVPILRAGRVRGVLALQHQHRHYYREEETDALATVAMVLAELIAEPELSIDGEPISRLGRMASEQRHGEAIHPGVAIGRVVLHDRSIPLQSIVADDSESEQERLDRALQKVRRSLDQILDQQDETDGEHREILATFRMFADDPGWRRRLTEAVNAGLSAEAAVRRVLDDTRARMRRVPDPYLRERLSDLEDLNIRVLRALAEAPGQDAVEPSRDLPERAILIATTMGPAELLDYPRDRVAGLVLEEGTASAHVAIIAKALDIPIIGQCPDIVAHARPGDAAIIDGTRGLVLLRPADDLIESYESAARERGSAEEKETQGAPVTADGVAVQLWANAGLMLDVDRLATLPAVAGIGLFRTEIPFMLMDRFPDAQAQERLYRQVLLGAGSRPVVFRTLDAGGDKVLPFFKAHDEENPALGWRAVRIGLDRPRFCAISCAPWFGPMRGGRCGSCCRW